MNDPTKPFHPTKNPMRVPVNDGFVTVPRRPDSPPGGTPSPGPFKNGPFENPIVTGDEPYRGNKGKPNP